MYAVIVTGGKQYEVKEGDVLLVEKLDREVGDVLDFEQVLLFDDGTTVEVGKPNLENVKVSAEVVGHQLGDKVRIVKFRRRKHSTKQTGYRHSFTQIKITKINRA